MFLGLCISGGGGVSKDCVYRVVCLYLALCLFLEFDVSTVECI